MTPEYFIASASAGLLATSGLAMLYLALILGCVARDVRTQLAIRRAEALGAKWKEPKLSDMGKFDEG